MVGDDLQEMGASKYIGGGDISEGIQKTREHLKDNENRFMDDSMVVRFYTAAKNDAKVAAETITRYVHWKKTYVSKLPYASKGDMPCLVSMRGINGFPDSNFFGDDPSITMAYGNFWRYIGARVMHKTDSYGHPILIDSIGQYNIIKIVNSTTIDKLCDWHVSNMELIETQILPACSDTTGAQVSSFVVIIDCSGVGLRHANTFCLKILKNISDIDANYYPERLHKLYIVNISTIVLRIWKIAKKWIDEEILKKVVVGQNLYNLVSPEEIPRGSIPTYLGGTCTCIGIAGGCNPRPSEIASLYSPMSP